MQTIQLTPPPINANKSRNYVHGCQYIVSNRKIESLYLNQKLLREITKQNKTQQQQKPAAFPLTLKCWSSHLSPPQPPYHSAGHVGQQSEVSEQSLLRATSSINQTAFVLLVSMVCFTRRLLLSSLECTSLYQHTCSCTRSLLAEINPLTEERQQQPALSQQINNIPIIFSCLKCFSKRVSCLFAGLQQEVCRYVVSSVVLRTKELTAVNDIKIMLSLPRKCRMKERPIRSPCYQGT